MPRVAQTYTWGKGIREQNKDLYNQLNESYENIAFVLNTKVSRRVILDQNPPASDEVNRNFEIGDVWVRTDADTAWMMTSRTDDITVTWTQIT